MLADLVISCDVVTGSATKAKARTIETSPDRRTPRDERWGGHGSSEVHPRKRCDQRCSLDHILKRYMEFCWVCVQRCVDKRTSGMSESMIAHL